MLNKLTVIVPIYNEEKTVVELLTRIDKAALINGVEKRDYRSRRWLNR